jgi:hypothetical protein
MASKQKPKSGESAQQPKTGDRVFAVRSRPEGFNRAGLRFTREVPTIVKESEIGTDRLEAILAEPLLDCRPAEE